MGGGFVYQLRAAIRILPAGLSILPLVFTFVATASDLRAQDPSQRPEENYKTVTFTLMRLPDDHEKLEARIAILSLDRGDSVTVRTSQGKLAGSVAPFGPRVGDKPTSFAVPIPKDAISEGKVILHLSVKSNDGKSARPPRDSEIKSIDLVIIPTS